MIGAVWQKRPPRRAAIALLLALAALASLMAIRHVPLDAMPDIADPQIVVYAKWPRSPELIESRITAPLAKALLGAPGVRAVRSTSHMGYVFTYVLLTSQAGRADVRREVGERVATLRRELPADAVVSLGPDAGSMGWIFQYALVDRAGLHDPRELRLLNDNRIKPALQAIPGIAEVASIGGLERQYQFKVFPPLLADAGLSLRDLVGELQSLSDEAGGRTVEVTNRDYQVRGGTGGHSIDRLESAAIGSDTSGKPLRLRDVGYVQVGFDQRRGIADLDGKGEVVGGIVIMEQGGNVLDLMRTIGGRLAELRRSLPEGVEVVATYDRSELIWGTLRHFLLTLAYELAVVIFVTLAFLRNARAAVAPVAVLLLGVLFTALPMYALGQTINLFSLAGLFIAIGEMVDATIVIVENCTAELAANPTTDPRERARVILASIASVARPLLFSLLIIVASFLPVFFLGDKESRMFDPLAYSKTFAMGFSTLLTLFVLPAIVLWIFRRKTRFAPGRRAVAFASAYRNTLGLAIRYRYVFLAANLAALGLAGYLYAGFATDFMPRMEEGSILYMPTTLPGVPVREAGWVLQKMDRKLAAFPEVARVFGKLGRADSATDSAPLSMIETTVLLKPVAQWRTGMTKDKLVAEMDQAMQVTGYANSWVQPIEARVMMQDTGIQTPVGLKIRGGDLTVVESIGRRLEKTLGRLPGTRSVIAERVSSGYFIDVELDPERLAQRGIALRDAMPVVQYAIGGDNVAKVPDQNGDLVPLSLQYAPEYLDSLEKVRHAAVVSTGGRYAELADVADVGVRKRPDMIRDDNGEKAGYVYVYLADHVHAADYVARAKRVVEGEVALPAGYTVEWTGEYQNVAAARARLQWVVPATLAIVFVLLVGAFRSLTDALLIMLSIPFALVGGVFLQWALGYPMSTAVVIGYIALFAVAIQTGIIMIVFIRLSLARRAPGSSYMAAVLDGSVLRLRPKLMTVGATVLSLLPVMLSDGAGMEIMKPIATPTVGGMLSSTVYVLFLLPCLFAVGDDLRRMRLGRTGAQVKDSSTTAQPKPLAEAVTGARARWG